MHYTGTEHLKAPVLGYFTDLLIEDHHFVPKAKVILPALWRQEKKKSLVRRDSINNIIMACAQ